MGRNMLLGFLGLLVLAGAVFAISGSGITATTLTDNPSTTSTSVSLQGGNLTQANLSVSMVTNKWAVVYGTVSGSVYVGFDVSTPFHFWSWSTSNGGEVCASTNSSFDWSNLLAGASLANLNTVLSFSNDVDNVSNTYNETGCSISLFSGTESITGAPWSNVTFANNTSSQSCALSVGGMGGATEGEYMFCASLTTLNASVDGSTVQYDYALLLPTDASKSNTAKTYYLYVELD